MKKTLLRVLTLLCALTLLLSLCSCSAARTVHASSRASRAVAKVGEMEIPYENLYYLAMNRIAELKAEHGEDALSDPARAAELAEFVWNNLYTEREALLSLAADYGVSIDSGEIADRVQEEMEQILENDFAGDRDAYIESLNAAYLTDRYVRTVIAVENYVADAVLMEMIERGDVDDSDETARARMADKNNFIRVRQVLIETRNYKDAAAALARANELRARVAAAETDSARVVAMNDAMVYSTYLDVDGNGLYFARGEMAADYETAAFSLPFYGVSEVLAVDGGYCFLLRMPTEDTYIETNFESLKQKTYYITLNGRLAQRQAELKLEKTRFGESLDLTDLPAIDADGGEVAYVLGIIGIVLGSVAIVVVAAVLIVRGRNRRKGGKTVKKKK